MKHIYVLSDPTETYSPLYVGATSQPRQRLYNHKRNAINPVSTKAKWINSLRRRNVSPEMTVLESVKDSDADETEKFYIAYFRALGIELINATDGGRGTPGHIVSDELRRRFSVAYEGKKHSPETCRKMSLARHGHSVSEATKEKLFMANRGRSTRLAASGIRGVYLTPHGRFRASVRKLGVVHQLGTFATADEAKQAYDSAKLALGL